MGSGEKLLRYMSNNYKYQDKEKIMPALDETLSSNNTKILFHQESLGRIKKSSSRDNIKYEKHLSNDNITYDKANSTIQVDAKHITDNRHFRKKKKLSYAEVLRKGKDINSPKIESSTTETPKITQNEVL